MPATKTNSGKPRRCGQHIYGRKHHPAITPQQTTYIYHSMTITMKANTHHINNKKTQLTTKNKNNKHTPQQQHIRRENNNDVNNNHAHQTDTTTTWGDQLGPKDPHKIRIVLQNIGGIDMADMGSIKLAALQSFMNTAQVNICTLTEC